MRYYFILILLTVFNTHATSWAELKVNDPIKSGSECLVNEAVSSGSYVFDWPSKYDQIFFPYTSSQAIWFCRDSGFIAFMGDFDNITAEEKTTISDYLKKHPQVNANSLLSKLELLVTIYSFRKLPPESDNLNKRIFAYLYEQINEFEIANNFRSAALGDIYKLLNTDLTQYRRLEYLYIAANYERQLDNIVNSELMLSRLLEEIENLNDKNLKNFGNYLFNLSKVTPQITPGGKLAPLSENESAPKSNGMIQNLVDKFPAACHEEIQIFFKNIEPMYSDHFNRTLLEKNVAELLDIRKLLIDTGNLSHSTIIEYYEYKGVGPELTNEVNNWKKITSEKCRNEVNEFYDIFSLEVSRHTANVIATIVADLTGVKDSFLYKDSTITIEQVDQVLIDKSIYYLYCYVREHDVYEHKPCPERAIPYKDIFIRLKADVINSPLNVADDVKIQKLFEGFSSLGI